MMFAWDLWSKDIDGCGNRWLLALNGFDIFFCEERTVVCKLKCVFPAHFRNVTAWSIACASDSNEKFMDNRGCPVVSPKDPERTWCGTRNIYKLKKHRCVTQKKEHLSDLTVEECSTSPWVPAAVSCTFASESFFPCGFEEPLGTFESPAVFFCVHQAFSLQWKHQEWCQDHILQFGWTPEIAGPRLAHSWWKPFGQSPRFQCPIFCISRQPQIVRLVGGLCGGCFHFCLQTYHTHLGKPLESQRGCDMSGRRKLELPETVICKKDHVKKTTPELAHQTFGNYAHLEILIWQKSLTVWGLVFMLGNGQIINTDFISWSIPNCKGF